MTLANDRSDWVAWLKSYGADKFFDAFMESAQNAESICRNCDEKIYLDIREGCGVPDWGTPLGGGLDYGCVASPDTNENGTGGHVPRKLKGANDNDH